MLVVHQFSTHLTVNNEGKENLKANCNGKMLSFAGVIKRNKELSVS